MLRAEEEEDWQRTWHALWDLLGGKWSFHVLRLLSASEYGFNEMERALDGITPKVLSQRLKELECRGFVDRSIEMTSPPATTYRLTSRGEEFADLLQQFERLVELIECEDAGNCAVLDAENDCPSPSARR